LKINKLGFSDLHLSEIGFGAWAVGGGGYAFGWGHQDDDQSIASIHKALDLGVNWIDTAAIYGLGHSEEVVGKAINGIRDEVIIATKCSAVWDEKRIVSSSLKADNVISECEKSLKRMNIDCIDLYQIHSPSDEKHIEDGWNAIYQLIKDGKVRYGGVSNFKVSHFERIQSTNPIASSQPPYSILRRNGENDGTFDFCEKNKIGIVAYSPMQAGLLTGSFDMSRVADDDWRKGAKEYKEPNLGINLDFVEELREIANHYNKTVAQLAIAWVLRDDRVTSAIIGTRNPKQIEQTVGGAGWKIEQDDLDQIDSLLVGRIEKIKAQNGYVHPS
jgi:aryl-alcohol dehydrogenase-like predicted oxidoreductase